MKRKRKLLTTSSDMSEQDSECDTTVDDTNESKTIETIPIHNVSNTTMHDQDDSIHDEEHLSELEDDTSEQNSVNEIQPYTENWKQNNEQDNKLLTTNFEVKVENRKVEGLITYLTDQQIFKFKISSGIS